MLLLDFLKVLLMPRYLNGSELNHVEIGLSACHISKMQVMNTIELSGDK